MGAKKTGFIYSKDHSVFPDESVMWTTLWQKNKGLFNKTVKNSLTGTTFALLVETITNLGPELPPITSRATTVDEVEIEKILVILEGNGYKDVGFIRKVKPRIDLRELLAPYCDWIVQPVSRKGHK